MMQIYIFTNAIKKKKKAQGRYLFYLLNIIIIATI